MQDWIEPTAQQVRAGNGYRRASLLRSAKKITPMKYLEYLKPTSNQTLREGIAELRRAEGAENDAAECMAPELLTDIDTHDAIHVLFGCPTNLAGEIVAHVWTAFGTTVSMQDMHRVNQHRDHKGNADLIPS